jgi:hypothetical protein
LEDITKDSAPKRVKNSKAGRTNES